MVSITSCKMFRYNDHKDKIIAAFQDPINQELVQQISDYVTVDIIPSKPKEQEHMESHIIPSKHSRNAAKPGKLPHDVKHDEHIDDIPEPDKVSDEDEIDIDTEKPNQDEMQSEESSQVDDDQSLEESTKLTGKNISSNTVLYTNNTCPLYDISNLSQEIKGTLNFRKETQGVSRVLIKDSELWIYYNDSINLNNVMGNVIESLNAANYYYLQFNRLARSDNAIVFEINFNTSNISMTEK